MICYFILGLLYLISLYTSVQLVINQSKNPFHILQKYIILGNLDGECYNVTNLHCDYVMCSGLVSVMHGWLAERPTLYQLRFIVSYISYDVTHSDHYPPVQTHLCLLAQSLGEVPSEVSL